MINSGWVGKCLTYRPAALCSSRRSAAPLSNRERGEAGVWPLLEGPTWCRTEPPSHPLSGEDTAHARHGHPPGGYAGQRPCTLAESAVPATNTDGREAGYFVPLAEQRSGAQHQPCAAKTFTALLTRGCSSPLRCSDLKTNSMSELTLLPGSGHSGYPNATSQGWELAVPLQGGAGSAVPAFLYFPPTLVLQPQRS